MANIKTPKKLIEVALPLDDINIEAAREKSIRHGHPSTLHLWWARRPLAAARAVLFAQLVNDPGYERHLGRGMNKEAAQKERERLFGIIRRLVKWENINNEEVLNEAREEIRKSWHETCELNKGMPGFDPDKIPAFHDPFAGGGAIPFEAQRLGLEAYASDLNPVAITLNKAMIEIPPRFFGLKPINPEVETQMIQTSSDWKGARGLAADVRYYGNIVREKAINRIGHLYPPAELPKEFGGGSSNIVAWIWARTVKSPNPAFSHVDVPLMTTFYLSAKHKKEAYLKPVVEGDSYHFDIIYGKPQNEYMTEIKNGTKLARGANFRCILSQTPITQDYIRKEFIEKRYGYKLIALVADSTFGRVYLKPTKEMERQALNVEPYWRPDLSMNQDSKDLVSGRGYGITHWDELFTSRQLNALSVYSELVTEIVDDIYQDALKAGRPIDNDVSLENGGKGAKAYAEAITVYLGMAVSRMSDICNSLCRWEVTKTQVRNLFGRQAIPMVWDFAEPNIFSKSAGDYGVSLNTLAKVIDNFQNDGNAVVLQADAQTQDISHDKVISTDPPYYDNIAYADLSDFFYIWLRRCLKGIFPSIYATLTVPKAEELVAVPYRHGGKKNAENFFLDGMTQVMQNIASKGHQAFPVTIYYAFKQSETAENGTSSTGWVTFLDAVITAGFSITGTWPMRTELANRMVGADTNALASSIVLVCRQRSETAETISRRTFIRELNEVVPEALDMMVGGKTESSPVAAVDLQQASIGPGMSVFSKYKAILEADGTQMTVRTALQLINRVVDAYLNTSDGELDADTLYCLNWFDQYGWNRGQYGQAELLATAKGTTVDGMNVAGVLESGQGKVRLLKWQEYPIYWMPEKENNTPVWEALHYLIRALQKEGEQVAGKLLAGMPSRSEAIRNLAYRLYTLCERKGWAEGARSYNELIASWDAIDAVAHEVGHYGTQLELF